MTAIPETFIDLFSREKKAFAHIATVMADGSPQLTPVWFDYDGQSIIINTAAGRVKHKTMQLGTKIAVEISDPENPYRYIQVRGAVSDITETNGDAVIDSLAKKYLGVDSYPYRKAGEQRVTYHISTDHIQING